MSTKLTDFVFDTDIYNLTKFGANRTTIGIGTIGSKITSNKFCKMSDNFYRALQGCPSFGGSKLACAIFFSFVIVEIILHMWVLPEILV